MSSHDDRETFVQRWLEERGLFPRYPQLTAEEILLACELVPVRDMSGEFIMFVGGAPTPGKEPR